MMTNKRLIIAFLSAFACTAYAAIGDTWTADLTAKNIPAGTTLNPGKGEGTLTITEQADGYFFWDVTSYKVPRFESIDLVYGTPDLPLVLPLTTEYIPDEITFFGNFTRTQLDEQLAANGFDESALFSNQLYGMIFYPNNTAIGGQITSNSIADFVNVVDAGAPSSGEEDFGDSISSETVYVAQMQNTSVVFFESGMLESNGTGSFILQDMLDGTYEWTLDIELFRYPKSLQLRYFDTLTSQPIVFNLTTDPRLEDKVTSYSGNFTQEELQTALRAIDAPENVIAAAFNVTPPVMMVNLNDKKNQTITGFIFDANAAATSQPIVKSSALELRASAAAAAAFIAGLFLLI